MTFLTLAYRCKFSAFCPLQISRFSSRLPLHINRNMSVVAKLSSPLKELVTGATQDGSSDFGKNEKDKAEVSEWIERIASGEAAKAESLKVRFGTQNILHKW